MPGGSSTKDNNDTNRGKDFNDKLRDSVKSNDQANRNRGGKR